MNGKDLMMGLSCIDQKLIEESECEVCRGDDP